MCACVYHACAVHIVYAAVLTCESWDHSKELIRMPNEKKEQFERRNMRYCNKWKPNKKEIYKPSISERPQNKLLRYRKKAGLYLREGVFN